MIDPKVKWTQSHFSRRLNWGTLGPIRALLGAKIAASAVHGYGKVPWIYFRPNLWVLGNEKNHKRKTSIHDGPGDSILDLGIDGGLHFRELTSSYAIKCRAPYILSIFSNGDTDFE